MSAPSFFRSLPMNRQELMPLIMLCLAAGLAVTFAAITGELIEGDLHGFDRAILYSLRQSHDPATPLGPLWLHVGARDVTALGSPAVLTIITASALGFLALKRQWGAALFVLVSICGGSALSFALKHLIQRERPDLVAAVAQTQTYSFPSGHAFLSAVTFLTLGALLASVQTKAEVKIYLMAVAIAITMLVGASRVYIGVHWPTDVLAGWCAGAAWAILCTLIAHRLQANAGPAMQTAPEP